jgi:hypothetical protein
VHVKIKYNNNSKKAAAAIAEKGENGDYKENQDGMPSP